MELTLVGLQYSGKTTFVNVIAVSNVSSSCTVSVGPGFYPGEAGIEACFEFMMNSH